jgi:hypothetical protein
MNISFTGTNKLGGGGMAQHKTAGNLFLMTLKLMGESLRSVRLFRKCNLSKLLESFCLHDKPWMSE